MRRNRQPSSTAITFCAATLALLIGGCGGDKEPTVTEPTKTDAGTSGADAETDGGQADAGSPENDAGQSAPDVVELSECEAACQPFLTCYADIAADECVELCESAATAEKTKKCLAESNHCAPLTECLGTEVTVKRAFDASPSGTGDWDLAGDFFVKTARGTLSFSQRWTGADQWFFVTRSGGYTYTENLWNSSMDDVFKNMPKNSQIVFAAFSDKDGTDNAVKHIGDIKATVETALDKLPKKDRWYWSKRVHFVTERLPLPSEQTSPDVASGWIADFAAARGRFCFAVDSRQRIRSCGNLRFPPNGSGVKQQVATLSYLARHFNFEDERLEALSKDKNVSEVTVFNKLGTTSKLVRYVTLPDAQELAKFDKMAVDLTVECLNHTDGNCAARASMLHLSICDLPSEATSANNVACDTEIARWSLPDGREGRWVTDVSPMLAALGNGGKRKFQLWTDEQIVKDGDNDKFITLKYTLKLRLHQANTGSRPSALIPLWGGKLGAAAPFDKTYNPAHPARTVAIPADAKKVELYGVISGHGWGKNDANCATFCKHSHVFNVGGKDFALDFDNAGTNNGCAQLAGKGMAPNQYSNWHYGRAGWCTGMDVKPFVADITKAVKTGTDAKISYLALYNGKPYKPKPKKDPASGAFDAEILRSTYLVISK